jgi:CRP-like cAMP-binding protein
MSVKFTSNPKDAKKPKKNVLRLPDDLHLFAMILEENPDLRERVLRHIERSLKKTHADRNKTV